MTPESLTRITAAIELEQHRILQAVSQLDKEKPAANLDTANAIWKERFLSCQEQQAMAVRIRQAVTREMISEPEEKE